MLEKDITPAILRAMRDDPRFGSGFVEVKVARGEKLQKGQLAEHQYRALQLATSVGGVYFKIPDCGFQNPCDAVILKKAEGWLVVVFEVKSAGTKKPTREVWAIPVRELGFFPVSISLSSARERGLRVPLE